MQRNDSSIDLYQKVKIDSLILPLIGDYNVFWSVSQVGVQRTMHGFLVDGHIVITLLFQKSTRAL